MTLRTSQDVFLSYRSQSHQKQKQKQNKKIDEGLKGPKGLIAWHLLKTLGLIVLAPQRKVLRLPIKFAE